jgi:hypothetical protein
LTVLRTLCLLALIGVLSAFGMMSTGCAAVGAMAAAYQEDEPVDIAAEYKGLDGKSVAVLVAAPMELQFEHTAAVPSITDLTSLMIAGAIPEVKVTPSRVVLAYQHNNVYWETMDYEDLGRDLRADRLVFIDLTEYRLLNPGNRYLWDGLAVADISVYELDGYDSMWPVFTAQVRAKFPEVAGVGRDQEHQATIEQGLQMSFSRKVSRLFHDHQRRFGDLRKERTRRTYEWD